MTLKSASAIVMGATAIAALPVAAGASDSHSVQRAFQAQGNEPVEVSVVTPSSIESTSSSFNVDVQLQARNSRGNDVLSGYKSVFVDPTGPDGKDNPAFHPGASPNAPGLVVTLSTTPKMDGTPLAGPRTNLANVFQINAVAKANRLTQSHNDWQVTSPGFFGRNTQATLKVYVVRGKAPDVVPAGGLTPASNVVTRTFRIGG
jgi:hypothetical protein